MNQIHEIIEEEFRCPICLAMFSYATSLACGHVFCKECLHTWIIRRMDCPLCRTAIRSSRKRPSITVDRVVRIYQSTDKDPLLAIHQIYETLRCCKCNGFSTCVTLECSHVICRPCALQRKCPICVTLINKCGPNLVLDSFMQKLVPIAVDLVVDTEVYLGECLDWLYD